MKPTSLSRSSIAPTWIGTSGIASAIRAIPSGAAIRERSLSRATPAALRISQARTAEPPVASIGSTTRATVIRGRGGELVVILGRPERRARRGRGRCARPRPRGSGRGPPRPSPARRGGSGRSRRCRPGPAPAAVPSGVVTSTGPGRQVGRRLLGQQHRQAPDQPPELRRPGRASPQGRELVMDQRMRRREDQRHAPLPRRDSGLGSTLPTAPGLDKWYTDVRRPAGSAFLPGFSQPDAVPARLAALGSSLVH